MNQNNNPDTKFNGMVAVIYGVVFVVLNLFVFLFLKNRNGVFWLSYIFLLLGFAVQFASMYLAFRSRAMEAIFMGIPLASLSLYYFFASVFAALVFMAFSVAPFRLALFVQILILAIYVVVAVLALMSRDAVERVEERVRENTTAIRTLNVDVDVLAEQVSDPALKKALDRLSETVRFSDPMSTSAVSSIEEEIMQKQNELRILTEAGQTGDAVQACKDMEVLFLQRNRLLKASK